MWKQNTLSMKNFHEEAEVIMMSQIKTLVEKGCTKFHVLCDDTNVFILLLFFHKEFSPSCEIFMVPLKQNTKVISITETAKKHIDIISNLLSVHNLSGCESVATMPGIEKKSVVKLLESQGCKLNLVCIENLYSSIEQGSKFIRYLYGAKNEVIVLSTCTSASGKNSDALFYPRNLPPHKSSFD